MGQTLVVVIGATLLNTLYAIIGLYDTRVTALARKRHYKDGYWIDVARIFTLVALQVLFHLGVGLHKYTVYIRLFWHTLSIFFFYLGTRMSVIGLTGGVACGKSTVVEQLVKISNGAIKIIDSDKIVHSIYEKPEFVEQVFRAFGKEEIVAADGKSVDRAKLGAIVFADRDKRRKLSKMIDRPIFFEILSQIIRLRLLKGENLVVLDAPLLFESKILEFFCHPIIVVAIADKDKQLERLMKRNDLKEDKAKNMIDSQMPLDAKITKADIVVDNSGSQEDLI